MFVTYVDAFDAVSVALTELTSVLEDIALEMYVRSAALI